jgi:hypothetical protein
MSTSHDIRKLESQLETQKHDLREDASQISEKFEATKAQLSPSNFVRERPILVPVTALLLGFALGYLLGRRKVPMETIAQSAVEHIGKPVIRSVLTTAGKEAVTRAIRGR